MKTKLCDSEFCPSTFFLTTHTPRHLLHEDFDVTVLRNGAQVLDDVPVLEVLVEGDLLVQRLRVPEKKKEKSGRSETLSTESDSILLSCFQTSSTHLLSLSGISLMAILTWLLRSLPAYTTP